MNPRDSTQSKKKKEAPKRSEGTRSRPRPLRNASKATAYSASSSKTQAPVAQPKPAPTSTRKPQSSGSVTHQALARQAVGRGVRHGFASAAAAPPESAAPHQIASLAQRGYTSTSAAAAAVSDSLSQLETNYRNVLNEGATAAAAADSHDPTPLSQMRSGSNFESGEFAGFLSRNSSLVDLAMIAPVDEEFPAPSSESNAQGFSFVDFPNPEVFPSNDQEKAPGE